MVWVCRIFVHSAFFWSIQWLLLSGFGLVGRTMFNIWELAVK